MQRAFAKDASVDHARYNLASIVADDAENNMRFLKGVLDWIDAGEDMTPERIQECRELIARRARNVADLKQMLDIWRDTLLSE